MQKNVLLVLLVFVQFFGLSAQDGMIGTGFANGWNYPADVASMQPSLGGSYIYTAQAAFGNANNFFRFTRTTDNNQLGPFGCVDTDWSGQPGVSYNDMPLCNNGAFFIFAPNTTDNYVFKTRFQSNDDFLYFRIEGDIFDFLPGQTGQDPANDMNDKVASDTPVMVSTVANPPSGQALYLRYSTDGFATSTVIQMADLLGILVYSAEIPGQPDGTTVEYYLFSSGSGAAGPASDGSDADYKTITYENNNGNNFSYTTDMALPVSYRSFEVARQAEDVVLQWTTATEQNADRFVIERSNDRGRNWLAIGEQSANNLSTGAGYLYLDRRAPKEALQYRLRQVDADGTAHYSRIVRVNGMKGKDDVQVFPQPVRDQVIIATQLQDYRNSKLEILNLSGQVLQQMPLTSERETVNASELAAGVYLLRIWEDGKLLTTRKMVKQ